MRLATIDRAGGVAQPGGLRSISRPSACSGTGTASPPPPPSCPER